MGQNQPVTADLSQAWPDVQMKEDIEAIGDVKDAPRCSKTLSDSNSA